MPGVQSRACGGRREPIPAGCSLTSMCVPWYMCTHTSHTPTHNSRNNKLAVVAPGKQRLVSSRSLRPAGLHSETLSKETNGVCIVRFSARLACTRPWASFPVQEQATAFFSLSTSGRWTLHSPHPPCLRNLCGIWCFVEGGTWFAVPCHSFSCDI